MVWLKQGCVYYYTHAVGDVDSLDLSSASCPWYDSTEAYWHTHGGDDPRYDNENFSNQDKSVSESAGIPGYLGTPRGSFQKYTPTTK